MNASYLLLLVGLAVPKDEPLELQLSTYVGALRTVPIRVGASESPFLFDSGGGATVISLATAQAIGCTPFGRGTGFRHDGTRVEGQRAGPIDISIGGFRRTGEVGVLDLDTMFAGMPKIGGIVSLQTFDGRAITLDLAHERLVVETAASLETRSRHARELVTRIARPAAGAALDVFVAVDGRHGPLWFELDSGNVAPVLLAPHAFAELGVEAPTPGKGKKLELPVRGLGPVACDVEAKEMIYDGLLNIDFCRRFSITLDLANGRSWADPASR
jgi:hypothetical protein